MGGVMKIEKYLAQEKYDKENTKRVSLKFNYNTDNDIISWLDNQENKQRAVKNAIREYVANRKGQ